MSLQIGDDFDGFDVIAVDDLEEYKSIGYRLRHRATGLDLYHIHNEDKENMFAFVFKTPPDDDSGVPHIIEHAVLAGSRKFPVKDPFLAMMKGSVNTFLNAMTYPDKTVYPAASPVQKDYFNLMAVYMDAVFAPLLKEEIFLQEGTRLEYDAEGKLQVSGVVYNEMKGAFSSFETIVADQSFRSLFPDSPYSHESGGVPESIRELDYSDFLQSYQRWYHPSNCRVFLYGDIPTREQTSRLAAYLDGFKDKHEPVSIPPQQNWTEAKRFHIEGPSGKDSSEKTTFTINWRLTPLSDPVKVLSLELLSEMLLGNPGSPMYKAIFDSEYGEDLSTACGIETDLQDLVFTLGVRGAETEQLDGFVDFVKNSLAEIVEKGIEPEVIEGALTRFEFRNREIKGGVPFGLRLMSKSMRGWLHGLDPAATLGFREHIAEIKELYKADPRYFDDLITTCMLNNNHYSEICVEASADYTEDKEREHNEWLEKKNSSLDDKGKSLLRHKKERFLAFQQQEDSPEDLEKIPSLVLSDIPDTIRRISSEKSFVAGRPLFVHDIFTNGIIYSDLAFPLPRLSREMDLLLPLFGKILTSSAVGDMTYDEVARKLSLLSGGLFSFIEINDHLMSREQQAYLFIRIKTTEEKNHEALKFLGEVMTKANLRDSGRTKDLLLEYRNELRSALVSSGHSFALLRAASYISESINREEQWRGIEQYRYITQLVSIFDEQKNEIADIFEQLRDILLNSEAVVANITAETSALATAREGLDTLIRTLPATSSPSGVTVSADPVDRTANSGKSPAPVYEAFSVPSTVNYVAAVVPGSLLHEKEYPLDALIAHLLKTEQLWEMIRMQGGAYGAFASVNGTEAVFSFGSYRDPNIASTYTAFKASLEDLQESLTDSKLEKAKISILGREFKPLAPGEMSMIGFRRELYGIDDELRQKKHSAIFHAGIDDVIARARQLAERLENNMVSVVIGNDGCIAEAAKTIKEFENNITELI